MSIYLEKYRTRAQELLKYMRDIRLAASRSNGWFKYDEQFRLRMSADIHASSASINTEFWLLYISGSQKPSTDNAVKGNPLSPVTLGSTVKNYCNHYNSGNNCRFSLDADTSTHANLVMASTQVSGAQKEPSSRRIQLADGMPIYTLGSTPIKSHVVNAYVESCPNKQDGFNLANCFQFGFSLQYSGPRTPREANHLKSANQAPYILRQKVDQEVSLNRVAGPFSRPPPIPYTSGIPIRPCSQER